MAEVPEPAETGRQILDQYKRHNIRPGEMLMFQNLNTWWMKNGGRGDDLVAGLEWLGEQEYIEQKDGHGDHILFLTEAGFAAM